jgi:hypothetical protein
LPIHWLVAVWGSCWIKLPDKNIAQYIPHVFLFCIFAVPYYWAEHFSTIFSPLNLHLIIIIIIITQFF